MRKVFLAIGLFFAFLTAHGQMTDPATQFQWPRLSGSGAPSAGLCVTANAGRIYTDKTNDKEYACDGTNWFGLNSSFQTGGTANGSQTVLNFTSGNGFTFSNSGANEFVSTDGTHYLPTTTDQTNWNGKISGPLTGDCSTSGSAITCTKTNGVSFAPSATTDTTNASNIASGTLPPGRLPLFTSTLNGAVAASGGGTTNFLRADGTWASPAFSSGFPIVLGSTSIGANSTTTTVAGLGVDGASATEIGYVAGVTSSIQTQLNNKSHVTVFSGTPTGTVDGSNKSFTLSGLTALPSQLNVWENFPLVPSVGYTVAASGGTVTITYTNAPQSGDTLYWQATNVN
jgi:hypothetical protein